MPCRSRAIFSGRILCLYGFIELDACGFLDRIGFELVFRLDWIGFGFWLFVWIWINVGVGLDLVFGFSFGLDFRFFRIGCLCWLRTVASH